MKEEQEVEQKFSSELQVQTAGLLKANKADIAAIINNAVQSVRDGNIDKLDAFIYAKKLETLSKDLVKRLKPLAEDTPIHKDYEKHSVSITQGMQGVSYDYSEVGDLVLDGLLKQQEELKKAIDTRCKFLQTVTKPMPMIDEESGEVYTINPPVKSGSLGFTLKIK